MKTIATRKRTAIATVAALPLVAALSLAPGMVAAEDYTLEVIYGTVVSYDSAANEVTMDDGNVYYLDMLHDQKPFQTGAKVNLVYKDTEGKKQVVFRDDTLTR